MSRLFFRPPDPEGLITEITCPIEAPLGEPDLEVTVECVVT
jgi:hypothetical protein